MGKTPCCSKIGLQKGPWTAKEDELLTNYIKANGEGQWTSLPAKAGLLRCGKSCRQRWKNYLRPNIRRGDITPEEDDIIIKMHALLGNRWSLIAGRLPGRTANEIKNYWNSHLSKRLRNQGIDPTTHKKIPCNLVKAVSHNRLHAQKHRFCKKNEEGEKVVVFNPKPIRVTTQFTDDNFWLTNNSNDSTEMGITCSSRGGENCKFTVAEWSNIDRIIGVDDVDGICFVVNEDCDDDGAVVDGLGSNGEDEKDGQCDQEMTANLTNDERRTLEKVYEEYLQLLKTDEN